MRGLGGPTAAELDPACHDVIDRASAAVNAIIAGEARVYGVNTGVGSLAKETISAEMASEMQRRLIVSHSAGTGPLLHDATVRRACVPATVPRSTASPTSPAAPPWSMSARWSNA